MNTLKINDKKTEKDKHPLIALYIMVTFDQNVYDLDQVWPNYCLDGKKNRKLTKEIDATGHKIRESCI